MIRRVLAVAATTAIVLVGTPTAGHAGIAPADNWQADFLHLDEAQAISRGAGVTVAVIDTGVDATHPELAGSIIPGYNPSGVGAADGRSDTDGHGTQMAGLIVGHGQLRGIAPDAKVMPIRSGTSTDEAKAIDWAVEHGAQVINISQGANIDSEQTRRAVNAALAAGVVVVAAAGNVPRVQAVVFPASYDGVIAAAAVGRTGDRAPVSIQGPKLVLAAPGDDNTVAIPGGGYATGKGTSISSAIISGVAALVKAKYPNLSGQEIYHRLVATADDKGPPGRDNDYGYGVVNPVRALTENVPPLATTPTANPDASADQQAAPPGDDDNSLPIVLIAALIGMAAIVTLVVVLARRRT